MNRAELFRQATERLKAAGIDNPRLEARLLLEHGAFDLDRLLARRIAREPLAYILGRKEFWSLDFDIGPGALVPRPETETLIEVALEVFPDRAAPLRILDLGSGSGCLIVTALTLYPNAAGTAVDISAQALDWTRRNAERHRVDSRLNLIEGGFEAAEGVFDLILSNPPYLTDAELAGADPELAYEPAGALAAGSDGLAAYRAVARAIRSGLAPAGRAVVELGIGQAESVAALFAAGGLHILNTKQDLAGVPRALLASLSGT